jgi:anti-sigma factor RsiW
MSECASIDPLVTPYVDGELSASDRMRLEAHLAKCPPCHSRVAAERAVHHMFEERRGAFTSSCAPAALKAKCTAACRPPLPVAPAASMSPAAISQPPFTPPPATRSFASRFAPFAAAAALIVIVGGTFVYQATERSAHVLAAELAADHMKCFALNSVLRTQQSRAAVESSMLAGFDWRMAVPEGDEADRLELVGARPCLYGEGKIAHIMYRHNGTPVSLFMLPGSSRQDELVSALGHECAIWSAGDRTFALVAREEPDDVARVAELLKTSIH